MILDQLVDVKISNQSKHYKLLGYLDVRQGTILLVPWQHLPKNSNKLLNCACDNYNLKFVRSLQLLNRQQNQLCYSPARKRVGDKNKGNNWGFNSSKFGKNHPRWNDNKSDFLKYKSEVYRITKNKICRC